MRFLGDIGGRKRGAVGYKGCEMGKVPTQRRATRREKRRPMNYARSHVCMKLRRRGPSGLFKIAQS